MKRGFINTAVFAVLTFIPMAAMAQSSYEVPEYSGQSPKFDSGMDRYRDSNNALRASRQRLQNIQRDHRNDLAVERHNAYRAERVQDGMARKREESLRANQRYILQTNE